MKIGIIRREYITNLDGVNKFIANLAEGLTKLGNEVKILTWSFYEKKENLSEFFRKNHMLDFEIEVIPLNDELKLNWPRVAFDWFKKGSKILKNFDAIIINGIIPIRFKKTKIAVNHGFTIETNRFYRLLAKILYKQCDKIVCVSKKLSEEFREFSGINPEVLRTSISALRLWRF